jgi:hypothetical protein
MSRPGHTALAETERSEMADQVRLTVVALARREGNKRTTSPYDLPAWKIFQASQKITGAETKLALPRGIEPLFQP